MLEHRDFLLKFPFISPTPVTCENNKLKMERKESIYTFCPEHPHMRTEGEKVELGDHPFCGTVYATHC